MILWALTPTPLYLSLTNTPIGACQLEADDIAQQLAEPFTPDDAFMFAPRSILKMDHSQMVSHSKESLSFDEVLH